MNPDSLSSSSDLPPSGSSTDERKPRSSSRPDSGTGYVSNVDELIQNTPLSLVLMHYGLQPPQNSTGEYRMKCVFNETCSDSQYGNLTVRQDVAKQIYCHSCETRGNLLTLIHGLETHHPPSGGRFRGQEFKAAVQKLRQINGEVTATQPQRTYKIPSEMKQQRREYESKPLPDGSQSSGRSPDRADPSSGRSPDQASNSPAQTTPESKPPAKLVNTPLIFHDKEAARDIADLYKDLIVDVAQMSPEAAQYVRKRPWMTPELMQKWGVGWIPGNGRSLFRKGYLVYTHRNERGEIISYIESRQFTNHRILLMPDCDEKGETGFKDLLWKLCEAQVQVRLGITSQTAEGRFARCQPEDLTDIDAQQFYLNRF